MLKRWHGRMGVMASLFVLLLAATGLALNHVSSWGLDRQVLRAPSLLGLYGMAEASVVTSYPLADAYISASNQQLFYQDKPLGVCEGDLVGVLALSPAAAAQVLVACERQLLLFSPTYELIEKIGPALGLPLVVQRLGLLDGRLLLETSQGRFFADLDALSWKAVEAQVDAASHAKTIQWSVTGRLPDELALALATIQGSEGITYERLLLDIHSGRIVGQWGVYLVDAMAILFMLLAISGVLIWLKGKKA
ncbi:hypothetical protein A9Q89_12885 [Gammaproteobacteria bacterium 53_120_T64]|nr:hypothetical protein A9Q89_12885 [Gammaproteobacteria bacterium 53_120_T64]